MRWSVHPAKYHRTKTILTLIFIGVFLCFVAVFYGVFWSLLGFIILFFSLNSYFLPTHYEVTETEVIVRKIFMTQKRRLSDFRKIYRGKNGILLSPFTRKTFLNQFRGIFLFLPPGDSEIEQYLRKRVGSDERASENDE